MVTRVPRLMVISKPLPATGLRLDKLPLRVEPLFGEPPLSARRRMAAESQWHIVEPEETGDEAEMWDLCHQLRRGGLGIAGAPEVEFAEPDFEQQWPFRTPSQQATKAFLATAAADACKRPDPPDPSFPLPSPFDWRWFQDAQHSGLDEARSAIENPADRVTIAHLDTGYRKGHKVLPQFLDLQRQRSFVNGDPDPNDASDPDIGGFSNNPGHGMGTLGLLAGNLFDGAPFQAPSGVVGGAPFARVIPVRVANSVVLFSNSSIARGLQYAIQNNVAVLSMSMGGVPSRVWADMVNLAYEAGITLVTAAGNNFGPSKLRVPRFIVYPARFRRVVAACGVMSDGSPYADFADPRKMGGSYGPDSKMDTAMAAYTPNTAWAKYACTELVDFDGAGTSSATPQIAAAAACWLQKNRRTVLAYPEKWMRVEAVRQALFATALDRDREHFGKGTLRAQVAMGVAPADASALRKTAVDAVGFPLLDPTWRALFGAAKSPASRQMLLTEAAQVVARNGDVQGILIETGLDPDVARKDLPPNAGKRLIDAMIADPRISKALKTVLGAPERKHPWVPGGIPDNAPTAEAPPISAPINRRLKVFAFDPSLGLRLDTESLNQATIEVPWEQDLRPGPVGEYLEVVDVDPSTDACYAPVDLNHPHLLASDGLDPAEGVPQFHQQMVYAVAMTTIKRFEHALGRVALWAPHVPMVEKDHDYREFYVQRLRLYPHALREANAFYSPATKSLLFGYFQANRNNAGLNLPGGLVFTCLSHDVVAHETTHALLDGLHRYYQHQTNPDIAAFHEAFADLVALFQHFTITDALRHTIARTRGNLRCDNLLAELAQQFGQATNGSRALRSALGRQPRVTDYEDATEPHDRGAVLVAAVFQAFLEIYDVRVADLKRLATGGTGVLPPGDISTDLVNRMSQEASKAATHVLNTCIRALDYCPPVDLTFGEYLRALITADMDVEPEDALNYRVAFISGFRARGIFPSGIRTLSEESLRWRPPLFTLEPERIRILLKSLDLSWDLSSKRREAYLHGESNGFLLWRWFHQHLHEQEKAALEQDLGVFLRPGPQVPSEVPLSPEGVPLLQIHSVRPARRINSQGGQLTDLVVEAVQRFVVQDANTGLPVTHRGGCTLLIDMRKECIRYVIRKRVGNPGRIQAETQFRRTAAEASQAYFDPSRGREPFAMLHRGA